MHSPQRDIFSIQTRCFLKLEAFVEARCVYAKFDSTLHVWLLATAHDCETGVLWFCSISYQESSNFLRRMLDENEGALERTGSNSTQIADLLYCISDNQSGHLRIGPFQSLRFRRAWAVRS